MSKTKNIQNFESGYENEIAYQKKMIKNLRHWQSLFSMFVGLSILLIYFFIHQNIWLFTTGIVLCVVNVMIVFTIGYAIYKGQKNVDKIENQYQLMLKTDE